MTPAPDHRRYRGRGDAWLVPSEGPSCEIVWSEDDAPALKSFLVPRERAWLVFERQAGLEGMYRERPRSAIEPDLRVERTDRARGNGRA
jgi:hypothetical protein